MDREPGAKAQLISALVAAVSYALVRYFHLAAEEHALLVPLLTYVAAQVVGWLWTRGLTTPVATPQLPEGTQVVVTTQEGNPMSTQTLTG